MGVLQVNFLHQRNGFLYFWANGSANISILRTPVGTFDPAAFVTVATIVGDYRYAIDPKVLNDRYFYCVTSLYKTTTDTSDTNLDEIVFDMDTETFSQTTILVDAMGAAGPTGNGVFSSILENGDVLVLFQKEYRSMGNGYRRPWYIHKSGGWQAGTWQTEIEIPTDTATVSYNFYNPFVHNNRVYAAGNTPAGTYRLILILPLTTGYVGEIAISTTWRSQAADYPFPSYYDATDDRTYMLNWTSPTQGDVYVISVVGADTLTTDTRTNHKLLFNTSYVSYHTGLWMHQTAAGDWFVGGSIYIDGYTFNSYRDGIIWKKKAADPWSTWTEITPHFYIDWPASLHYTGAASDDTWVYVYHGNSATFQTHVQIGNLINTMSAAITSTTSVVAGTIFDQIRQMSGAVQSPTSVAAGVMRGSVPLSGAVSSPLSVAIGSLSQGAIWNGLRSVSGIVSTVSRIDNGLIQRPGMTGYVIATTSFVTGVMARQSVAVLTGAIASTMSMASGAIHTTKNSSVLALRYAVRAIAQQNYNEAYALESPTGERLPLVQISIRSVTGDPITHTLFFPMEMQIAVIPDQLSFLHVLGDLESLVYTINVQAIDATTKGLFVYGQSTITRPAIDWGEQKIEYSRRSGTQKTLRVAGNVDLLSGDTIDINGQTKTAISVTTHLSLNHGYFSEVTI